MNPHIPSHSLVAATLVVAAGAALTRQPSRFEFEQVQRPPLSNPRGRHQGPGARVPGKFKKRARASR